jgi:hypothetical protein
MKKVIAEALIGLVASIPQNSKHYIFLVLLLNIDIF